MALIMGVRLTNDKYVHGEFKPEKGCRGWWEFEPPKGMCGSGEIACGICPIRCHCDEDGEEYCLDSGMFAGFFSGEFGGDKVAAIKDIGSTDPEAEGIWWESRGSAKHLQGDRDGT